MSECADKHRLLPRSSAESGRYRTARTPYLKEVADSLGVTCDTTQVKVMKGTQLGFTEVGNNWLLYIAMYAPGPMLMVLPTEALVRRHAKQKLNPTIRLMPELRAKIVDPRHKTGGSTMISKEFTGGFMDMGWANSGVTFRSGSYKFGFADEVDAWPWEVPGEGEPLGLFYNRFDTFGTRKKLYKVSTPVAEGASRIVQEYKNSDQRKYNVPCPFCKKLIIFKFGEKGTKHGFKFETDKDHNLISDVRYMCEHCHKLIEEFHKTDMLEQGVWVPENEGHEHRGYHLPSFYSPLGWLSWREIVTEYLDAVKSLKTGDATKMRRVVTTRFAETFSESEDSFEPEDLYARREIYHADVPSGALVLTCAVDTQDKYLECVVMGWGVGEESWIIETMRFNGSPTEDKVWEALDNALFRTYRQESGKQLKIEWTNIDAGGHHTARVYEFTKTREGRNIFAIIGSPDFKADIVDANKVLGAKFRKVGVHTCKNILHGRLKIPKPEGNERKHGYIHYPNALPLEFFTQLLGEERNAKGLWVPVAGRRNEALDLYNYNLAAVRMLRVDWEALSLGRAEGQGRRVFKSYNASRHLDPSVAVDPNYPILVVCDFKKNPLIWLLAQTDGKKAWVFDEIRIDAGDSMQMTMRILRQYGKHALGLIVYGSPQGAVRGSSGKSEYTLLASYGLSTQRVRRSEAPLTDRVNAINAMLDSVTGEAMLTIHPQCINLKRDLEQCLWLDDMSDMDRTTFERNNAVETLSHFIHYEWPLRANAPTKQRRFYK